MGKPLIFISCGQGSEKELGGQICALVRSAGLEPFFAENQHDLNGVDANILRKLQEASGLIAVLHPRGDISDPARGRVTRASVWVEQELAIAAYIERVEKRPFHVLIFKHEAVSREGLRDFVHINPFAFRTDAEVLAQLPSLLEQWRNLAPTGTNIRVAAENRRQEQGHDIVDLNVYLTNETNSALDQYSGWLRILGALVSHWGTTHYPHEDKTETNPRYRCFRFNKEDGRPTVAPRSRAKVFQLAYCVACAIKNYGDHPELAELAVSEAPVDVKLWSNGREYSDVRPLKEIAIETSGGRKAPAW